SDHDQRTPPAHAHVWCSHPARSSFRPRTVAAKPRAGRGRVGAKVGGISTPVKPSSRLGAVGQLMAQYLAHRVPWYGLDPAPLAGPLVRSEALRAPAVKLGGQPVAGTRGHHVRDDPLPPLGGRYAR